MAAVYCLWGINRKRVIYVGSTTRDDLTKRLAEHAKNAGGYTKKMSEKKLLLYLTCPEANVRAVEYYLKEHRGVIDALLLRSTDQRKLHSWETWLQLHHIAVVPTLMVGKEHWQHLRQGIFKGEGA